MFADDAACLDYLVRKLYPDGIFCPKCERVTKHHRERMRPSYSCQFCGHREHPMVGTIFQDSATSLKLWFDAIYLMASTRCGISAKQLERELGVTYKTAWRMFNKIRSMLGQDGDPFAGTVEMDEAYWGGKDKWRHAGQHKGRGPNAKTMVFGMAQRGSNGSKGKVHVQVPKGNSQVTWWPVAAAKVLPASTVYTDNWQAYKSLGTMGYTHERVNHEQRVYVSGDVHTNTIEGFWSLVRRGIGGTYHSVSTKHLQSYLDEYAFRYNNREATGIGMTGAFLDRVVRKVAG